MEDTETDLLLRAKDERIRQLEKSTATKDRRIDELKKLAESHKNQTAKTLELLEEEMQISSKYQIRCGQLLAQLRIVNDREQTEQSGVNKEDEIANLSVQLEAIEKEKNAIQQRLSNTVNDLEEKQSRLKDVAHRETQLKLDLGLPEDATHHELRERIQGLVKTKLEFTRAQKEFGDVHQETMMLSEGIATLCHEKDKLSFDLRRTELQAKRLRRIRSDRTILDIGLLSPKNKRMPLGRAGKSMSFGGQIPLLSSNVDVESKISDMKLYHTYMRPGIEVDRKIPGSSNAWSSRLMPPISEKETKYCVLCRKTYYLKRACSIHVESIHNGKYSCCGKDGIAKISSGCKEVNHLYIYFTGVGNEYSFYDEQDRQLDFKTKNFF